MTFDGDLSSRSSIVAGDGESSQAKLAWWWWWNWITVERRKKNAEVKQCRWEQALLEAQLWSQRRLMIKRLSQNVNKISRTETWVNDLPGKILRYLIGLDECIIILFISLSLSLKMSKLVDLSCHQQTKRQTTYIHANELVDPFSAISSQLQL